MDAEQVEVGWLKRDQPLSVISPPRVRLVGCSMSIDRLGDHFPHVPKACKSAAEPFFACLTEATTVDKITNVNWKADAFAACKKPMVAYDACVKKNMKPMPPYRVPEAYRRAPASS